MKSLFQTQNPLFCHHILLLSTKETFMRLISKGLLSFESRLMNCRWVEGAVIDWDMAIMWQVVQAEPTGTHAHTHCNTLLRCLHKTSNTGHFCQTHLINMASRKKCLVLGFLAFLWAELGIEHKEEKEEEHTRRFLGKFDLNGYVDARNRSPVTGGLLPIHYRTIPSNESDLEPVLAKGEG